MVTPDGHLLDVGHLGSSLEGELSECSVVVESGHGGEVLSWKIWSVVLADESVGVGWVSNDNGLGITGAVEFDTILHPDSPDYETIQEQSGGDLSA